MDNLTIEQARAMSKTYLGYANGWIGRPAEMQEAEEKGYAFMEESRGRCCTRYYCPEGGFYYDVDSSD